MTLPLQGIKVLEVAEMLFGPGTTAILADWGAEVIKIEHPTRGDRIRGVTSSGVVPMADVNYLFQQANRGKRSVAIDLHTPAGIDIVHKLAAKVDVFVTNFLEDARHRLRIAYRDLAAINPRLVYVSVNGYGHRGDERNKGGYDYAAFWSRNGFALALGSPGEPPVAQRPGVGDYTSALSASGAVAAALFQRERSGKGAQIDVALQACGMWVNSADILAAYYSGRSIPRLHRLDMGNPLWNCYQTRDSRWIQLVMLQTDPYWTGFCHALGRTDLEFDERFASHSERCANNRMLIEVLDGIFAGKTLAEWSGALTERGMLWTVVQDVSEVIDDPQALANGFIAACGELKLIGSPAQFDGRETEIGSPAPECGQHTEEVLLEMGYSWQDIASFKAEGTIS